MFQQEEMRYVWDGTAYGYAGDARCEDAPPYSRVGQKLIREASSQAPTAVQRLALALVSLGMLMGTTILLTILAGAPSAPGWDEKKGTSPLFHFLSANDNPLALSALRSCLIAFGPIPWSCLSSTSLTLVKCSSRR